MYIDILDSKQFNVGKIFFFFTIFWIFFTIFEIKTSCFFLNEECIHAKVLLSHQKHVIQFHVIKVNLWSAPICVKGNQNNLQTPRILPRRDRTPGFWNSWIRPLWIRHCLPRERERERERERVSEPVNTTSFQLIKFTRKSLPFRQNVIFVYLTVVHYFYYIFKKNHSLSIIHHIFKMLQSCGRKSFHYILKPRQLQGDVATMDPLGTLSSTQTRLRISFPPTQYPGSAPGIFFHSFLTFEEYA